MKLNVILRTHDGKSVHPRDRFISELKSEIVRRCVKSLLTSMASVNDTESISLTVVDDNSTIETTTWIREQLLSYPFSTSFVPLEVRGNGQSMRKCYEIGLQKEGELVYLVEDDYLHKPEAIQTMLTNYDIFSRNLGGKPLVLVPYDDPLDYRPDRMMPTRIVPGSDRHWRQNFHTTFTMLFSKWILLHFWDKFMAMTQYGVDGICEDNTINLIYTKFDIFLFSPMPGLAIHMCDIPPAVGNWMEDWKQADEKNWQSTIH